MAANDQDQNLTRWSATQLAQGIRERRISSVEVVEACLAQIEARNPSINALVDIRSGESLAAARAADAQLARGLPVGELHGVPVSIKINTDQRGYSTTQGVAAYENNIATADAPAVGNLRDAGAVFIGRSNAPAFSFRWFTANDLHGETLNPWDSSRTPGGSSGGAAAAVVAGMVPIAHGTDIGGSVRYPAYACGVAGIRPTVRPQLNWLSRPDTAYKPGRDLPLSRQLLSVPGVIARSTRDLRVGVRAMWSGQVVESFRPHDRGVGESRRPVIGVVRDIGIATPDATVDAAIDVAADWLRAAGYSVYEVELAGLDEAYRMWNYFLFADTRDRLPTMRALGDDTLKLYLESSLRVAEEMWPGLFTLETYTNVWARRGTLIDEVEAQLQDFPVILMPSSSQPPAKVDIDTQGLDAVRDLTATMWPMLAGAALGFPGVSVPTGIVDKLPTGVQLIGGRYSDHLLLDAADAIEAAAGYFWPD